MVPSKPSKPIVVTPSDLGTDDAARAGRTEHNFRTLFGGIPRIYRAPGRINLIGEHTDYSDGFVLPFAMQLACWVAAAPRSDGLVVAHSVNLDRRIELDCTQPILPRGEWSDHVACIAAELIATGCPMSGATLTIESDVPMGAGLSSSAALEIAVALALLDLAGFAMDRTSVAALCQRAEICAGAAVGIMDHYVALHGQRGGALLIDCRSLSHRLVPLPSGVCAIACNTMVHHAHAGGEYNRRRREIQEALESVAESIPGVRSLRDLDPRQLPEAERLLPPLLFRRARHVVTENARVLDAAGALEDGDLNRVGALLAASHDSLRDDYEVSCRELDEMVSIASGLPGVIGSRLTGGGFGGSTVSLVREEAVDEFCRRLPALYEARTGVRPEIYVAASADGAGRVGG
jgi:galactokinase